MFKSVKNWYDAKIAPLSWRQKAQVYLSTGSLAVLTLGLLAADFWFHYGGCVKETGESTIELFIDSTREKLIRNDIAVNERNIELYDRLMDIKGPYSWSEMSHGDVIALMKEGIREKHVLPLEIIASGEWNVNTLPAIARLIEPTHESARLYLRIDNNYTFKDMVEDGLNNENIPIVHAFLDNGFDNTCYLDMLLETGNMSWDALELWKAIKPIIDSNQSNLAGVVQAGAEAGDAADITELLAAQIDIYDIEKIYETRQKDPERFRYMLAFGKSGLRSWASGSMFENTSIKATEINLLLAKLYVRNRINEFNIDDKIAEAESNARVEALGDLEKPSGEFSDKVSYGSLYASGSVRIGVYVQRDQKKAIGNAQLAMTAFRDVAKKRKIEMHMLETEKELREALQKYDIVIFAGYDDLGRGLDVSDADRPPRFIRMGKELVVLHSYEGLGYDFAEGELIGKKKDGSYVIEAGCEGIKELEVKCKMFMHITSLGRDRYQDIWKEHFEGTEYWPTRCSDPDDVGKIIEKLVLKLANNETVDRWDL